MEPEREDILRALEKVALSNPNDGVILALRGREAPVETLDLWGVSEVKVSGNGGVEIKFADRVKALTLLLEHLGSGGDGMAALLDALEGGE